MAGLAEIISEDGVIWLSLCDGIVFLFFFYSVSGTADMLFSLGVRYCEVVCDTINSCIEFSASIHYSGLDNKTKHAHFKGNNSKDQRPWERD